MMVLSDVIVFSFLSAIDDFSLFQFFCDGESFREEQEYLFMSRYPKKTPQVLSLITKLRR